MCQSKSRKGKSRKLKMREEELQDLLLSLRFLINMTTSERNHSFLRSALNFFSVSLLV